jgi:acid phosphatase family membrane protein YuiD
MQGILFGNRILDTVFVAWFIAQFWKVVRAYAKERRINFKRFIETGGMPSSHSSTVMALVTAVARSQENGTQSVEFAISMVLAIIVMYDAAGVRRAAGKQASLLNKIVKDIKDQRGIKLMEENLKEFLGHTPVEVIVGGMLGIAVAILMTK